MAKRSAPEVNAGSMADIAFLLLIFFLVTTDIATDSGLNRKLPPIEETDPPIIKEKNIFQLSVNKNDQLLLKANGSDGDIIELKDLRQAAIDFLDNGGGKADEACTFCQGKKNPKSSDNPIKAIISLQNDRATKYKTYIAVQNELIAAYNTLRDREYQRLYPNDGMTFVEANTKFNDPVTEQKEKDKLKAKLIVVKELIPQKLSEAEPKSN